MITKIKFYLLVLADYMRLGQLTSEILNQYDDVELQLTLVKTKLKDAVEKLEGSLILLDTSVFTEELAKLDGDRDAAWMCFYHLVISQSNRLNGEISDKANLLLSLVKLPEMRMYKQGYKDQSVNLNNFFNRIDSDASLTAAIVVISASEQYAELKAAQLAFDTKEIERANKEAEIPKSQSEEARKEIRSSMEDLDKLLHVFSQLTGKNEYAQIAGEINEVVSGINTSAISRSTRRENSQEEEINIEG